MTRRPERAVPRPAPAQGAQRGPRRRDLRAVQDRQFLMVAQRLDPGGRRPDERLRRRHAPKPQPPGPLLLPADDRDHRVDAKIEDRAVFHPGGGRKGQPHLRSTADVQDHEQGLIPAAAARIRDQGLDPGAGVCPLAAERRRGLGPGFGRQELGHRLDRAGLDGQLLLQRQRDHIHAEHGAQLGRGTVDGRHRAGRPRPGRILGDERKPKDAAPRIVVEFAVQGDARRGRDIPHRRGAQGFGGKIVQKRKIVQKHTAMNLWKRGYTCCI